MIEIKSSRFARNFFFFMKQGLILVYTNLNN